MKYFPLLLLFACNEPANKATPRPNEPSRRDACTSALASFDRFVDTGEPDAPPERRAQIKTAVLQRCMKDNWSEPALSCMRSAQTSHDTFKCWNDLLTKEQRDVASTALGNLKP